MQQEEIDYAVWQIGTLADDLMALPPEELASNKVGLGHAMTSLELICSRLSAPNLQAAE